MLETALKLARAGQHTAARKIIADVLKRDPRHEQAWLVLAFIAQTIEERRSALDQVLRHNPTHARAAQALRNTLTPDYVRLASASGVFISYAHADAAIATQIAEDLRFLGVPAWLDMLDMNAEQDWNEAVAAALQTCGLMLVIASDAALRAENVHIEVEHFRAAGKIVVPLQLEACDLSPFGLWHAPLDFTVDYMLGMEELLHLLDAASPAYNA
ncbi:MAG: TIR domain-containing protein [Anaerolineae bacterium]|nr:TIR domain-containing protein [Anaerolineae bacterium]